MRTMRASLAVVAAMGSMGVFSAGCAPGATSVTGEDQGHGYNAVATPNVHLMPKHPELTQGALLTTSAPSGAHLAYLGGPVLANVSVWTVFWDSTVPSQSDVNGFYSTITSSPYFDWLSEYNTPSQAIGHGQLGGSVVDTGAPSGTTISDAQIQQEIGRLIGAGQLPPNDGNNLYMVYFPAGVSITQGGSQSCVQFCAYHGTFLLGGNNAYYGVIPDLSGACASGCGTGDKLQNTTSVSSHELIEAVTDPAVGLAQGLAAPIAWYDQTNGEIGDICNAQQAVVSGYTVQLEFSNQAGDCIATAPGGGGSSSGGGGAGGSGSGAGAGGGTGGTGGGCAHDVCTSGGGLVSSCDPCAAQLCAQDAYCCSTAWDATCVGEVASICGQTCP